MKVRSVSSPGRSIAGGLLLAVCLLGACSTAPGVAVRAPYGGSTPKFDNGPADEVKIGSERCRGSARCWWMGGG